MARSIAITLKRSWKQTWASHIQRGQIVIGSALMIAISCMLPSFFNIIQKRDGILLNDWILAALPAYNVSWAIFTIIWGVGLFGLWRAIEKPTIYITYVWSLIFITVLRVLAISLVALDPPKGLVTLSDPLTGIFYGESNITKDLFFSGHTSILYLAYLCVERKRDKTIMLIATIIVACLLLVQHVHYTVDVVAAFLIVYPVNKFVKYLLA